jgi:hypothetical protein
MLYHKILSKLEPKDLKKSTDSSSYQIFIVVFGMFETQAAHWEYYLTSDYAKSVADTRNKEAIEYCDLFRKFIEHIKKTPDYIELNRDKQINKILQ